MELSVACFTTTTNSVVENYKKVKLILDNMSLPYTETDLEYGKILVVSIDDQYIESILELESTTYIFKKCLWYGVISHRLTTVTRCSNIHRYGLSIKDGTLYAGINTCLSES